MCEKGNATGLRAGLAQIPIPQIVGKFPKSRNLFPGPGFFARPQLLAKSASGEEAMYAKKWFVRSVFGLGLTAALALGAQAQTADPTPQQQDIHQDKKDIRQDKRDLALISATSITTRPIWPRIASIAMLTSERSVMIRRT